MHRWAQPLTSKSAIFLNFSNYRSTSVSGLRVQSSWDSLSSTAQALDREFFSPRRSRDLTFLELLLLITEDLFLRILSHRADYPAI